MRYQTLGNTVFKDGKLLLECTSYEKAKVKTNELNLPDIQRRAKAVAVKEEAE